MISLTVFTIVTLCMIFEALITLKSTKKVRDPAVSAQFFRYKTPHVGEWMQILMNIFFWIYTGAALVVAIVLGWRLPSSGVSTDKHFCILRIMPFFPPILSGTMAGIIATSQPPSRAVPMLIGGTTMQGFGFLMFLMVLAQCFIELNADGLPEAYCRPEMFITVGPPSFTIAALIGMATAAVEKLPEHYISDATSVRTADVLLIVAVFASITIWTLSFFLFSVSMISLVQALWKQSTSFGLLWWCMVFPNTGFVLATAKISSALNSVAVGWVATAMTMLQLRDFVRKGMEMRRKA